MFYNYLLHHLSSPGKSKFSLATRPLSLRGEKLKGLRPRHFVPFKELFMGVLLDCIPSLTFYNARQKENVGILFGRKLILRIRYSKYGIVYDRKKRQTFQNQNASLSPKRDFLVEHAVVCTTQ